MPGVSNFAACKHFLKREDPEWSQAKTEKLAVTTNGRELFICGNRVAWWVNKRTFRWTMCGWTSTATRQTLQRIGITVHTHKENQFVMGRDGMPIRISPSRIYSQKIGDHRYLRFDDRGLLGVGETVIGRPYTIFDQENLTFRFRSTDPIAIKQDLQSIGESASIMGKDRVLYLRLSNFFKPDLSSVMVPMFESKPVKKFDPNDVWGCKIHKNKSLKAYSKWQGAQNDA